MDENSIPVLNGTAKKSTVTNNDERKKSVEDAESPDSSSANDIRRNAYYTFYLLTY